MCLCAVNLCVCAVSESCVRAHTRPAWREHWSLIVHKNSFYSTFVVTTPESSNEFPWISIWRLVKPHASYCVNILKARWLRPAIAESYRSLRATLSKKLVAVHVWNAPDQWHNWRVAGVRTPPAKINVKTGPLPTVACILVFIILLVSVDCCFFVFRSVFRWFRVFV